MPLLNHLSMYVVVRVPHNGWRSGRHECGPYHGETGVMNAARTTAKRAS